MTRKSRREIEREIEAIGPGESRQDAIFTYHEDPITGQFYNEDREPIEELPDEGYLMLVEMTRSTVMPREQAEQEGRTIVEPADVPADGHVVVRPEWMD